jgi:hypothetical protein
MPDTPSENNVSQREIVNQLIKHFQTIPPLLKARYPWKEADQLVFQLHQQIILEEQKKEFGEEELGGRSVEIPIGHGLPSLLIRQKL